ncbi:hypothetical protein [Wenyingzhuangia sp. IMCC45574]
MKTFSISRIINSDSQTLFRIVSEFENYKNWNTIIPKAKGTLKNDEQLDLLMNINGKTTNFNPTVISINEKHSFLLSKTILSKKIAEVTHLFEFKQLEKNKTEFIQTWTGNGILINLIWSKLQKGFADFDIFNNDLEAFIEKKMLIRSKYHCSPISNKY